jgi:hypothetical protein
MGKSHQNETLHDFKQTMNQETVSHMVPVRFLHPVGQSTLRQGVTVPVEAQVSWLAQIRKGEKVTIAIRFGQGQSVQTYLRRINNAVGHLQFRYETRQQSELRDYLVETFGEKPESAILEIMEVEPRVFLFSPVSISHAPTKLSLYKPHFHNLDESNVRVVPEFHELDRCLASISYDAEHSQADYNKQITDFLIAAGWRNEVRILKEIGLRCDFEKNGMWLEVEFGNARTYYQDYIKMLLASHYREARFGVLLCPTDAFAQLLCVLGQKRALAKHINKSQVPKYSGMMSYEKAIRELPFLQFMLNRGIVIAGIDMQGIA